MSRLGLRWRLSLLSLVTFGLSTAILCGFLYRSISRYQVEAFDGALHNFAIDVAQSLEVDFFGNIISTNFFAGSEKILPFSLGDTIVQLRDGAGRSLARSGSLGGAELPLIAADIRIALSEAHAMRTITLERTRERSLEYRLATLAIDRPSGQRYLLQVAAPLRGLNHSLQKLAIVFWLAVPLMLLLGFAASWFLSGRAIKPLRVITGAARKIEPWQLSDRLPLPRVKDETYELTVTLNSLLDRLENAFESQDHFVAHVSHQLRTPLAIAQGELELLLAKVTDPASRESLTVSIEELKYLGRLVSHLLVLTKIEAGAGTLARSLVRLDEIILDVLARQERRANERRIKLRCNLVTGAGSECFEFSGDGDLLRSMIENLVDNAIQYSPPDSVVQVCLSEDERGLSVRVIDQGRGIPLGDQANLFQRYYRASGAAARSGHGLGLVVAREIAEIHGGSIGLVSDGVLGSEFKVDLPKIAPKRVKKWLTLRVGKSARQDSVRPEISA